MSPRILSTYLQMFLNNGSSILQPRSIAQMRSIVGGGLIPIFIQNPIHNSTHEGPPATFGLSWYWQTLKDGRRYLGHSGSVPGMVHLMLVNEKHNLGVILLSNVDAMVPDDLSKEIREVGINIHVSLFECFDTDREHSLGSQLRGTLLGFLSSFLFLLFTLL